MKIIVLDGVPLNPGDLSWRELELLGEVTVYERTAPAEVAARIAEAELVLTNKVKLNGENFALAPHLKYIGELATGYDNIDVAAARAAGIAVCNVPSYSARFTAQTTIALLLELAQRVGLHSDQVMGLKWSHQPDFSFWETPQVELAGKTLVILGLGTIGKHVARIGEALGMHIIAAQGPGRPSGSENPRLPLEQALPLADVVSLHCPLRPETRGLVGEDFLAQMKPSALLINTARGALIDEAALAKALESGQIAGFAGDVLSVEPPPLSNPLFRAPNCLITPHLGWSSLESRRRCLDTSIANVAAFLSGKIQNQVN